MVSSPGVLETSDQEEREAFQKAKILYKSCMNESEFLPVPLMLSLDTKGTKVPMHFQAEVRSVSKHGLAWKADLQTDE